VGEKKTLPTPQKYLPRIVVKLKLLVHFLRKMAQIFFFERDKSQVLRKQLHLKKTHVVNGRTNTSNKHRCA
jgi:hypothetical protein